MLYQATQSSTNTSPSSIQQDEVQKHNRYLEVAITRNVNTKNVTVNKHQQHKTNDNKNHNTVTILQSNQKTSLRLE
jgi:hypothetical protein